MRAALCTQNPVALRAAAQVCGIVLALLGGPVLGQEAVAPQSAPSQTAPASREGADPAQGFSAGQVIEVPSPILTLDWEDLYARSAWGQRVAAEVATASADLNRENTRIADDLVNEERSLTTRRAGMAVAAFRAEADAFDARVVGIRRAQETKARALAARSDAERTEFINQAIGLLDAMIEARGAVVVIDRRAIIRGAQMVDVTADMVARADAAFGDGAGLSQPAPPAPETTPAPEAMPSPEVTPAPETAPKAQP